MPDDGLPSSVARHVTLSRHLRGLDTSELWLSVYADEDVSPGPDSPLKSASTHETERQAALEALASDGFEDAAEKLGGIEATDRPASAMLEALRGASAPRVRDVLTDVLVSSDASTASLGASDGALADMAADASGSPGEYVVHGRAMAPDQITVGMHGKKAWPGDEQEKAAPSLVGKEVSVLHEDEAIPVGRVLKARYDPEGGLQYEAALSSREAALALASGDLEVSPEAAVPDHDHIGRLDDGTPFMRDYQFGRLAIVSSGAGDTHAAWGPGSDNPAFAALTVSDDTVTN